MDTCIFWWEWWWKSQSLRRGRQLSKSQIWLWSRALKRANGRASLRNQDTWFFEWFKMILFGCRNLIRLTESFFVRWLYGRTIDVWCIYLPRRPWFDVNRQRADIDSIGNGPISRLWFNLMRQRADIEAAVVLVPYCAHHNVSRRLLWYCGNEIPASYWSNWSTLCWSS